MKPDVEVLAQKCAQYLAEEPDETLRDEILHLQASKEHEQELMSRMGQHLRFGTAGLRGHMQAGYNRMNVPAVYRLAHALAVRIAGRKAVIGFDGRQKSQLFAEEVAQVLGRMGIKVFSFSEVVPTPLCAFATKYLSAEVGVMITASHNPGYDNGLKLFDQFGAQANGQILDDIELAMSEAPLRPDFYAEESQQTFEVEIISEAIFDAYFKAIKQTRFFEAHDLDHSVKIIYTALHGVGQKFFVRALADSGFKNISVVNDQAVPDGDFPTLSFPNPEEEHTLDLAHMQAIQHHCEWVFANDPDADRLQVSCPDLSGMYKKLSGNEMGSILGFFAIERALERGETPLVASSIVSSRMLKKIAGDLGAYYVDALTGFSNIAHAAMAAEHASKSRFVFGYEEAIGFLVGDVVMDKDGINAGARFMEIAAWLKRQNMSVWDLLDQLYMRFGLFMNTQWSTRYSGVLALSHMRGVMDRVRALDSQELASKLKLDQACKFDLSKPLNTGPYAGIQADVVIFEQENNCRLIVRPSGTEPKIKFYFEVMQHANNLQDLSTKKFKLADDLLDCKRLIEDILHQRGKI